MDRSDGQMDRWTDGQKGRWMCVYVYRERYVVYADIVCVCVRACMGMCILISVYIYIYTYLYTCTYIHA